MDSVICVKKARILQETFRCIICFQYPPPPIYICLYEHIICATCLKGTENEQCGLCHTVFKRSNVLEKFAESILTTCEYGCGSELELADVATHQMACELGPWKCVFGCSTTLPSPTYTLSHLKSKHNLETSLTQVGEGKYYYNTSHLFHGCRRDDAFGERDLLLIDFDTQKFIIEEIITRSKIMIAVRLIGTKKQADMYRVKVTFRGTNIINKMSVVTNVVTIKDSMNVLQDGGHAANFPLTYLFKWCPETITGKHEWATAIRLQTRKNEME